MKKSVVIIIPVPWAKDAVEVHIGFATSVVIASALSVVLWALFAG